MSNLISVIKFLQTQKIIQFTTVKYGLEKESFILDFGSPF